VIRHTWAELLCDTDLHLGDWPQQTALCTMVDWTRYTVGKGLAEALAMMLGEGVTVCPHRH